ncbi:MAG: 4-hydroxythreonine-4-phosphate dehydrogenase PdxA [Nitrospirae bacterium]|nr:4-hydroxythreonine-4-phosphate dehydrogenase PdxA [Nitrospirota bacterium]
MGDPYGIGPEIVAKSLSSKKLPGANYSVVGLKEVFDALPARRRRRLNLIEPKATETPSDFTKPRVSAAGGHAAAACIRKGVEMILAGEADALVTAPICKEALHAAGYTWPGHTEMLSELTRAPRHAMMFAGPRLKVSLATIHTAVRDLPTLITMDRVLDTIELTHEAMRRWFRRAKPKIAVAGLNPHAGENGAFGTEDKDRIAPAVELSRQKGVDATGPLPADTLFYRLYRGEFDAGVCMYHDQALAPFKMIHFKDGVNLTLGLPFVRTSPDHGTAFDLAWRNRADPSSLIAAIRLAANLAGKGRRS